MSNIEIIHAYRKLLRAGLQAVQYSLPARFTVQKQLEKAFRKSKREDFDAEATRRTIWFLKAAAEEAGLEHKILKNLLRIAYEREKEVKFFSFKMRVRAEESPNKLREIANPIKRTAYAHYEETIAMLNHSMGLCLWIK